MKNKFTILCIFILIGFNFSILKAQYTYQICVKQPSDTSKIIKNEIIGFTDTTLAVLSGQVIDETKKELQYVNVMLTNTKNKKIYGQSSNEKGEYEISIPPGKYLLKISYIGYSDLTKIITLKTGELRKIEIMLGQEAIYITYTIKSDKKLNKRQLKKKTQELQNKINWKIH